MHRVALLLPCLAVLCHAPSAAAGAAALDATGVWTPIPPGGSRVQVLAAAPGSPTVFAGTAYGGVFRTFDRGASWQAASDGLAGVDVRILAARQDGVSTLYAGTESGLFRSDDSAASWRATGFQGAPAALAIAPSAPATLYGADAGAVYRSDDGGGSWALLSDFSTVATLSALAVDASSAQHVYLGGWGVIFISRTGGQRWRQVPVLAASQVYALAADPARAGSVFAATGGGVLVTRDGGGHWSPVAGLPIGAYTAVGFAFGAPGTVYAATDRARGRLWKSTDGGVTWNLVLSGSPFTAVIGDPLRPQRAYVAATPDGVLHGPLDGAAGGSWQAQQAGLDASAVSALAIDPHTPGLLYAVAQLAPATAAYANLPLGLPSSLLRVSADGGATWRTAAGLPPAQGVLADPAAAGAAYAFAAPVFQAAGKLPASVSTALSHTADGGATWQPLASAPFGAFDIAAAATAPRTLFAAGYGVDDFGRPCPIGCQALAARSDDGGATWSLTNLPIGLAALPPDSSGWFVRVDPTDAQTVYLAEAGSLLETADGGQTWNPLAAAGSLADLAIDPRQPQHLYGVRSDGTAVASADGGQTWGAPAPGLPAAAGRRLAIVAGTPFPTLYAATGNGVFVSKDGGSIWAALAGLPVSPALTVAADPAGAVYAGVEGAGGLFAIVPP